MKTICRNYQLSHVVWDFSPHQFSSPTEQGWVRVENATAKIYNFFVFVLAAASAKLYIAITIYITDCFSSLHWLKKRNSHYTGQSKGKVWLVRLPFLKYSAKEKLSLLSAISPKKRSAHNECDTSSQHDQYLYHSKYVSFWYDIRVFCQHHRYMCCEHCFQY